MSQINALKLISQNLSDRVCGCAILTGMKQNQTPRCRLKALGARWLTTARMALAFARCLLRLSEKNPRRALECAHMFELWLAAEAAKLTCETAAYDCSGTDDIHVRKLQAAAMCFVAMILFVQRLKRLFAEKIAKLAASGFCAPVIATVPRAPSRLVPLIDTS